MLLEEHYRQLLGLGAEWKVERVYLNTKGRQVDIWVGHGGGRERCPHCKALAPLYDRSAERKWRHLDTMQFATVIHASPPRVECDVCGVVTAEVPWAGRHSRFTLAFERFAVEVLLACGGPGKAAALLGLEWKQAQGIMERAVERGMARREEEEIAWAGIDEKAFRHGFHYVSVLTDIEGGRVLDVVEGRCAEDAECLIANALSERQRAMVCGVAMDMSAAYEAAVRRMLPDADIVHDKFHIAKLLSDAVDKTRRREHGRLSKAGDTTLKGARYALLRSPEDLDDGERAQLDGIRARSLDVAKAWHVKNLFADFWTRRDKQSARRFFDFWFAEAVKTGLSTVRKVAATLKSHLENILTYFDSFISNAAAEGFNSKIGSLKSNARGFRSFPNFRTSILFYCGGLSLYP